MKKLLILSLLFFSIISACTPLVSEEVIQSAIAQTESANLIEASQPTQTLQKIETQAPTQTSSPTPTIISKNITANIPEISPLEVIQYLIEKGLDCTEFSSENSTGWTCIDETPSISKYLLILVIITGRTSDSIDQLFASAAPFNTEYSHNYVINLFGDLVALPYKNSTPDKTRSWLETVLIENDVVERTSYEAGGVNFVLEKMERGYYLEVGKKADDPQIMPSPAAELPTPTSPVTNSEEKSSEAGPLVQQSITQQGQYLVPEEMQPGQWSYKANDPEDKCWTRTYSDLSGSNDSELDIFYSFNKGFFVLNNNVRMVELTFNLDKPCTWTRIGD